MVNATAPRPEATITATRAGKWIDPFPFAAEALALALFYFCLAWIFYSFAYSGRGVGASWPPSAVLLGVLLRTRRSYWPLYVIGALLASLAAGLAHIGSWQVSGGLAAATIVETLVAAAVLRRLYPQAFHLTDFGQLAALFGLGALAIASSGAVISASLLYFIGIGAFWQTWLNWSIAGTTGILVICPLLLTWYDASASQRLATRRDMIEATVTLGVTGVATAIIFNQMTVLPLFLILPLAIWTAFRFGIFLTAFLCLMVALISMGMTWLGSGPIIGLGGGHVDVELRLLQGFIAVMTSTSLTIAMAWERSRMAARELVLNEERFRDFAESTSDRFWETDEHHRFTWLSRPGLDSNFAPDEFLGKTRIEMAGGDLTRDELWRRHYEDIDGRRPFRDFHYTMRSKNGRQQYRRVSGRPLFDEHGTFKGYRGTVTDATKSMETRLLATQLGHIIEESLNEIYVVDAQTLRFILVNRGARDNLGYSMDELRNMSPADFVIGLTDDEMHAKLRELDSDNRNKLTIEIAHRRKDGTTYDTETHLQRIAIGQIPPVYVAVVLDITSRKQTQAELEAKSLLLRTTLDTMAQGICVYDKELRLAAFNQKYVEMFSFPEGFIRVGGRLEDHLRTCAMRGLFGPGDPEKQVATRIRAARGRAPGSRVYRRPSGMAIGSHRRPMLQGGFVTTFSDITQRQDAEEALHKSTAALQDTTASFEAAIKASRQILYDWNTRDDSVKWDGETDLILGYTAKELEGLPNWMELIHPDDRRTFVRTRAQAVMEQDVFSLEYRVRRKDGCYIPVGDRGVFLAGTQGGVKRIVGFISDMSAQKATEEALRQSDKLLAVGQLTGGIAHDFNNLLAIILGNIELLSEDLSSDDRHQHHIQTALTAAHRGAALTQRLLSFARKQPLQPRTTRINHLVSDMSELLQRSLDPSVSLEMVLADNMWTTRIDPSGLENALLNLALNARDAMPKGGKLILETRNTHLDQKYADLHREVRPGDYVMLSVTDTGAGMAPDIRDRAFEPFFTTKPVGQGSGLGLPMVYGFVKQSRGHVQIDSEPGVGTSVKLYLPRDELEAAPEAEQQLREPARGGGGGERVLVVEDNEEVRSLTDLVLTGLGYRTVLAPDAQRALDILTATHDIDVLFTDIILPGGTNGFELAQQARALRPSLKVLYTSGYTNNAVMQSGAADDTMMLIAKPYRKAELALKMRQLLAKESANGQP